MPRARDMICALRIAVVWLLVLIIAPLGGGSFELEGRSEAACESWCPCDEAEPPAQAELGEAHEGCDEDEDEAAPCEEDCDEDCSGCCDARVAVAVVGLVGLPATRLRGVPTSRPPPPDAPGCNVPTGVFRPPPSLS